MQRVSTGRTVVWQLDGGDTNRVMATDSFGTGVGNRGREKVVYTGLGATGVQLDPNDVTTLASMLGLVLPTGFTSWGALVTAADSGQHFAIMAQAPAAQAFVDGFNAVRQIDANGNHYPVASVVANITTNLDPRQYPGVSGPALSQYVTAVRTLFPKIWTAYETYAPGETWDLSDPAVAAIVGRSAASVSANTAWQQALAAGAFTAPNGYQVPTSFIVAGPTTLPDGTVYLQYHDPRSNTSPVLWWNGSTYRPVTVSPGNPIVKDANNDMIQLRDRGTGDWYRCMIVYGDDDACRPPSSFQGPYTLPASVLPSLANQAGVSPIAPPVAVAPPALMLAPPPLPPAVIQADPRVDTSASDPTQPVPSSSDPSGLSEAQVSPPPPAPYSPLLPSQGAAAQQAVSPMVIGLAVVAGALGLALLGKRGR